MGNKVDSSLTRVAPFFLWLTRRKGVPPFEWIPEMIRSGDKDRSLVGSLAQVIENDLRSSPGSVEIVLEKSLPPREAFLRWLIENPEKLSWEKMESSISEKDADTPGKKLNKSNRLKLRTAGTERGKTIEEAKKRLDSAGAEGSRFKWWAFEGFTSVDCTIRTENALILVEGKRTESVSKKASWYEGRNQIVRNIEAAYQWANKTLPQGKTVGSVLVIHTFD